MVLQEKLHHIIFQESARPRYTVFGGSSSVNHTMPSCFLHSFTQHSLWHPFLGAKIARLNGEETSNSEHLLRTHRLLPFLSMIRRTFDRVGWTWESEIEELRTFDDFGQLLQELESVDPGSYTFRYPVETAGQASVPHHFIFHIPTFCQRMDALLDMLETAVMGLEVTYDDMCEAIANSLNASR